MFFYYILPARLYFTDKIGDKNMYWKKLWIVITDVSFEWDCGSPVFWLMWYVAHTVVRAISLYYNVCWWCDLQTCTRWSPWRCELQWSWCTARRRLSNWSSKRVRTLLLWTCVYCTAAALLTWLPVCTSCCLDIDTGYLLDFSLKYVLHLDAEYVPL